MIEIEEVKMIQKRIVFVLGAGASVPYGFPTGQGLREKICTNILGTNWPLRNRLKEVGHTDDEIIRFANEFKNSGFASIDAFIARRPEWREIAEHAIAATLLPLEDLSMLNGVGGVLGRGDWYQYLLSILLDGAAKAEDILRNKIKFVTFNYDRSLEVFLHYALKDGFGLDEPRAASVVGALDILHVYGSLGDYSAERGYGYGTADIDAIRRAAVTLKTVPLTRPEVLQEAVDWIEQAHKIFFLGFGFDEMNCTRLGLPDAFASNLQGSRAFFSSFGLTDSEKELIRRRVVHEVSLAKLEPVEGTCLDLLRKKVVELR